MAWHVARTVCGVLLLWAAAATAAPSVTIVATDPSQAMVVGRNDSVYVHLHYHSEQPVRVRIAAMLDGQHINLINGVSPPYRAGDGDVVVWLGSVRPPQTIDTVKVTLVDNHEHGLDVVTKPLRIS